MFKQACTFCKIVGAVAIIGAWNWGVIGALKVDPVAKIFGEMSPITRLIYVLVGLSGLALFASYFMVCPACCKTAGKKS